MSVASRLDMDNVDRAIFDICEQQIMQISHNTSTDRIANFENVYLVIKPICLKLM